MQRFAVWVGETVRVRFSFHDEVGAPIAATGVKAWARSPAGTVVELTVGAGTEAGSFYTDMAASAAGRWAVRASCTGPTPAAIEREIDVGQSLVFPTGLPA